MSQTKRKHDAVSASSRRSRGATTKSFSDALQALDAFGVELVEDTCWCMLTEPVVPSIKWRVGADRLREVRALRARFGRPPACSADFDEELRRLGYFRSFYGAAAGVASRRAGVVFLSGARGASCCWCVSVSWLVAEQIV